MELTSKKEPKKVPRAKLIGKDENCQSLAKKSYSECHSDRNYAHNLNTAEVNFKEYGIYNDDASSTSSDMLTHINLQRMMK